MPRNANPKVAVAGIPIIMLVFAVFIVMIFVTASYGIATNVGNLIPFWALALVIALLGVGVMLGAAFTVTKAHLH